MVFNNMEDIKRYVLSQSRVALEKAKQEVYMIIARFLKEYYAEYTPDVYERTYQLYKSLVQTNVVSNGNGWTAEIFFDSDLLDYSIKHMTKYINDGVYVNPYNHATSSNGDFNSSGWSEEKTLESAMVGTHPHGGYATGTAVWVESINVLNKQYGKILKRMLKDSGIRVV